MTPDAEAPFILTLDVGSSSVRALGFDRRARAIPGLEARAAYALRTTPDGGVEGDPEGLFELVGGVIDAVLAKMGPRSSSLRAVAATTFWHSLLGVGRDGAPLTPFFTWGDTRSSPQWLALRKELDERAHHARTGGYFHPCYHPSKLRWLRETRPRDFEAAARWLSFGEFLYDRLFGRTLTTVSMASGTGLLDVRRCAYDAGILEALGVPEDRFPPLGDPGDFLRGLRPPFAERWPALRELPWMPPVGDGACNNLGSGCSGPDRLGVMIGTTGAMRVVLPEVPDPLPWGAFCYRADRKRSVLGGALSEGGSLVEWIRSTFRIDDLEGAEPVLEAMEPDSHGLTFLPFIAGERGPGYAAEARATISGLSLHSKPLHVLRAGLEAVALRFALIRELIRPAVPGLREVVASGGGFLKSGVWVGILADALGVPITASAEPEASCRGATLLALEALGEIRDAAELPAATGRTVRPDPVRTAVYQDALRRQQACYELLVAPR
jgi:gluconokinase